MQKTNNIRSVTSDCKKIINHSSQNGHSSLSKSQTLNPLSQSAPTKAELDQFFRNTMKSLIANNEAYFQNKLIISENGKKKDLRLKIPSKTGITIYKKDYNRKYRLRVGNGEQWIKNGSGEWIRVDHRANQGGIGAGTGTGVGKENQQHSGNQCGNMGECGRYTTKDNCKGALDQSSIDCAKLYKFPNQQKIPLKFDAKTMYQNEYVPIPLQGIQNHCKKSSNAALVPDDAPRFFQTHNKTEYLNWAGRNYVPSTKPQPKPAITLAPFNAHSVYKTDFSGKPSQHPTSKFVRQSTFPKFSNMSMITQSNYASEFGKKQPTNAEIDCRPKNSQGGLGCGFKGNTEYQSEYVLATIDKKEVAGKRSLEDLQSLIIQQL